MKESSREEVKEGTGIDQNSAALQAPGLSSDSCGAREGSTLTSEVA